MQRCDLNMKQKLTIASHPLYGASMPMLHPVQGHERAGFMPTPHVLRRPVADWRDVTCGLGLAMVLTLCAGGCTHKAEQPPSSDATVTTHEVKGPVTLTLSAAPDELDPSQSAHVVVEVLAQRGVTVREADYRQALSEGDRRFEYRIVESSSEKATPTEDGRLRWRNEYEIEFFLPGEYELPPAEVSFIDTRTTAKDDKGRVDTTGADEQTLTTEPVTLIVRKPQTGQLTEAELRQITRLDPVELPREWGVWVWLGPLVAIVVVVLAVWLARTLRRRQAEAVARTPAHVWAGQQIAALLAEDLIGRGRIQEFYYRISDIVRGYIERRFAVRAPEMTTEEFLTAAVRDTRFGPSLTFELDRFLRTCDLVKYARYEPRPGESDTVVQATRDFVERTREDLAPTIKGTTEPPRTEDRAA